MTRDRKQRRVRVCSMGKWMKQQRRLYFSYGLLTGVGFAMIAWPTFQYLIIPAISELLYFAIAFFEWETPPGWLILITLGIILVISAKIIVDWCVKPFL